MGASARAPRVRTPTPGAAQPALASAVVSRRLRAAVDAATEVGGVKPALRAFLEFLATEPIEVSPEEARAAAYVAGAERIPLDLDDPESPTALVLRGNPVFSVDTFASVTGTARSGVRRVLQELRDEGLLEHVGSVHSGLWRPVVDEPPEILWPDTDRSKGWVIDKNGAGYAI